MNAVTVVAVAAVAVAVVVEAVKKAFVRVVLTSDDANIHDFLDAMIVKLRTEVSEWVQASLDIELVMLWDTLECTELDVLVNVANDDDDGSTDGSGYDAGSICLNDDGDDENANDCHRHQRNVLIPCSL